MLFQVLCGFEPIFYTTHPNEEPQNGFDKYRENIWDNIEKICRKSTLIQQCNM